MEKKLKGEQFQIRDPANFPLKPVRPNRILIIVVGLLAGLGGGVASAFLLDNLDTSFKKSEEINTLCECAVTRDAACSNHSRYRLGAAAGAGTTGAGFDRNPRHRNRLCPNFGSHVLLGKMRTHGSSTISNAFRTQSGSV